MTTGPRRKRRIYTVGHSTRSQEQLLEILREAQVETLVDVRSFPSSRRYPHFSREQMSAWLPAAGIEYVHLPALGGRRTADASSPNTGWRHAAFRGYADYMASDEFAEGLTQLEQLASGSSTAIACAEAVWWRCHRRLVADALVVRGWEVEHLGSGARQLHTLTSFAHLGEDGVLTYPQAQLSLDANTKEE